MKKSKFGFILYNSILILSVIVWGFYGRIQFKGVLLFSGDWPTKILDLTLGLLVAATLICGLVPWYQKKYRGLGIEQHIRKATIIGMALLTVYLAFFYFGLVGNVIRVLFIFFFAIINFMNGVLVYYHVQDDDKTPPSYFAANLYLKSIFVLLFTLISFDVLACPVPRWQSQNKVQVGDVTITRPNDRWRLIINHDNTALAKLVYMKSGKNLEIQVEKITKLNRKITPKKLTQKILKPWRAQGYAFGPVDHTNSESTTVGAKTNGEHILVGVHHTHGNSAAVLATMTMTSGELKTSKSRLNDFDFVVKNLKINFRP